MRLALKIMVALFLGFSLSSCGIHEDKKSKVDSSSKSQPDTVQTPTQTPTSTDTTNTSVNSKNPEDLNQFIWTTYESECKGYLNYLEKLEYPQHYCDTQTSYIFDKTTKKLTKHYKKFSSDDFSCTDQFLVYTYYYDIPTDVVLDKNLNLYKIPLNLVKTTLTPVVGEIVSMLKEESAFGIDNWEIYKEQDITGKNMDGTTSSKQSMLYTSWSVLVGNRIYMGASNEFFPTRINNIYEFIKK